MKQPIFSGCATALITPFTPDSKDVDHGFYEDIIDFQIRNKADAIVVAGTTGESPVLSEKEKEDLLSSAVKAVGKRIPVIMGTGSNNTEEAVKRSNAAEKKGVDGLLIVTPFYNKCTQEGVIEHYFYIADRVSTPIIVYNVPSRTGFNIEPETYAALSKHKNICAIKEANGNISSVAKTAALCGNDLTIYSGNDDQTVPIMSLGGKGVISVASNIIPRQMHELASQMLSGHTEKARDIQLEYLELMGLLFCETNPIPVKYAAQLIYGRKCPLRLPLTEISIRHREKLREALLAYNII